MAKETFETCWDDDQLEISEWITNQLYKNTNGWFRITVEVEEVKEEIEE